MGHLLILIKDTVMRVLITGGSGFLARGIVSYWPDNDYILYSRDEYKQDMARQIFTNGTKRTGETFKLQWVLGDICDFQSLVHAMQGVDLVIHTAAVKYIPEAEFNVHECMRVNLEGSNNVVEAAIATGVKRVVGISTDKAVQPVNTYGMTKALMERLFAEANRFGETVFTCTRYGNVVGSTGSVFTVFDRQLATNGVLTLTDPSMTRYWQSVQQSVDLIRRSSMSDPGTVLVPTGSSMHMQKLASYLLSKHEGKELEVIGTRPGEKKHESLIGKYESTRARAIQGGYLIYPVGSKQTSDEFELSSETAFSLSYEDMDEMMRQAKCISY